MLRRRNRAKFSKGLWVQPDEHRGSQQDETQFFVVQSKALSKRHAVPLGTDLHSLRSDWWIITVHANSDTPACYVLRLEDVRALATQDRNGDRWWLEPRAYDWDESREAWHRLVLEPPQSVPMRG